MLSKNPLVSVLMTSFNRENFIEDSIKSVLNSEYVNFELIISDDESKDSTVEIAEKYAKIDSRIKVYVNKQNMGDYPNRNLAAFYAKGKYIKYVDSDDIIYPHGLSVMVNSMEAYPEAGFGLSAVGDKASTFPICLSPRNAYLEHFKGLGHFNRAPGSSIIKTSAFEVVGGFSGKRMIGDNELWLRLARTFPMVKFPVDLYWARTHAGQESNSDYAKQYDVLRKQIFEEAFSHPECPLTKDEIISIRKRMVSKNIKNKILKVFS